MKTISNKILWYLLLLSCVSVNAQSAAHWTCNGYDFEYDMAVCFSLEYNDEFVVDTENYEVAAFCDDECRGVGEFQIVTLADGKTSNYGYIRIRSNNKEDETIIFKVYDKTLNLERNVTETVSFINQELIGMPSNPIQFKFYEDRPVVVTVNDYQRTYGDDNPIFEFTVEGVELIGVPEISCDANQTSSVGDYPITISKGSLKNTNVTYVNGTLTVTKAPLTISIGNYTKKQYDPMPEFSVTYEGFKNNETEAVLITQPVLSCEADEDSAPGEYAIIVKDAEANNYEIQYVSGKLTVTEPDSYILTYMVDGEVYQSFTVKYRESITPLDAPEKEGYTFGGWSEIPTTMPAKDVTVTGSFTVNSYTLTYIVDGEEYKSFTVKFREAITPLEAPTKEGYTFSGWNGLPRSMPANDVVVKGSFTINKYILTYIVDGVEYKSYEINYATPITSEAEPSKEGYTFSGWSEIPETMPANDVVVTGTFTVNSYTVRFMYKDEVLYTEEVNYGESIPLPELYDDYGLRIKWSDVPETMPAHDIVILVDETDAVLNTQGENKDDIKIYDLNGHRLASPQKGINIIRYSDGTSRKVLIK